MSHDLPIRLIYVIGMPSGGTSCTAGILTKNGFWNEGIDRGFESKGALRLWSSLDIPKFNDCKVQEEEGVWTANSVDGSMAVLDGGRCFMRNGLRPFAKEASPHDRWLVGELDGVKAYYDGHTVVLSKQDMYP